MSKLNIKQLILLMPLLLLLASCNKRQSKAEQLVRDYLNQRMGISDTYKSKGFSEVEKLKDILLPGAKAPLRAFGRWEIEHTYRYTSAAGTSVTETRIFYIDSAFTHASCCYVKIPRMQ